MENLRNGDDVDGQLFGPMSGSPRRPPAYKSKGSDHWSADGDVARDGSRCEITIAADLAEYTPTPAEMRDFLQNMAGHYELGWTWKRVRTLEAAREQARALINSAQAVLSDIEDSLLGAQAAYELLVEELKVETTVE